jgi:hypothetical protein
MAALAAAAAVRRQAHYISLGMSRMLAAVWMVLTVASAKLDELDAGGNLTITPMGDPPSPVIESEAEHSELDAPHLPRSLLSLECTLDCPVAVYGDRAAMGDAVAGMWEDIEEADECDGCEMVVYQPVEDEKCEHVSEPHSAGSEIAQLHDRLAWLNSFEQFVLSQMEADAVVTFAGAGAGPGEAKRATQQVERKQVGKASSEVAGRGLKSCLRAGGGAVTRASSWSHASQRGFLTPIEEERVQCVRWSSEEF